MSMDQRNFDIDTSDESDITLEDLMDSVDDVLEQYDSMSSDGYPSDVSDEVYTVRVGGPEKEFVDDLSEALTTNRAETLRLIINLAAAHLQKVHVSTEKVDALDAELTAVQETLREIDAQLPPVEDISTQLDRIEDRLEQREDTERPSSSWEQGEPDGDDDDDDEDSLYDDVANPENIDIDLPDPDEV
jgi:DNA repair exonuclease SbcCD ATPase subunit